MRSLLALALLAAPAIAMMPRVKMEDLAKMAGKNSLKDVDATQWKSLDSKTEFLPVLGQQQQYLRKSSRQLNENEDNMMMFHYEDLRDPVEDTGEDTVYHTQPFVDGLTEYDEYQQAWRMLGFMVDCDVLDGDEWEDNGRRMLNSGDDVEEDGCARFILWAAYVDLDYQGGGIGEYQYYDRHSGKWDKSACAYSDTDRCAKMDCHREDSNMVLLGFFKHRSYDDWMEQLFKHEGMCVWTEEEYAFMKGARKAWPQGCVAAGHSSYGDALYYDIKPLTEGRITMALYTDSQCTVEYSDDPEMIEGILGYNPFAAAEASGSGDYSNYDFSSDTLAESMERWHDAFSEWSYCHPCVAFDVTNVDGTNYLYQDDDAQYYNDDAAGRKRRLGGEYDAQGDIFECYDDAGYTNVNQCMKFSAKTNMETATFRDLSLARLQNSIPDSSLSGFYKHEEYHRYGWQNFWTIVIYVLSMACCLYGCVYCWKAEKESPFDLDREVVGFLEKSTRGEDLADTDDSDSDAEGTAASTNAHVTVETKNNNGSENSKEKPLLAQEEEQKKKKSSRRKSKKSSRKSSSRKSQLQEF